MRPMDDETYIEYKLEIEAQFRNVDKDFPPKMASSFVAELFISEPEDIDTVLGLMTIAIGEYELRHNIIEERIINSCAYHIYRYENMGRYKDDLQPDERELLEKDIEYIKSKLVLPECVSYEDRTWEELTAD